jgi:hypothetical protein
MLAYRNLVTNPIIQVKDSGKQNSKVHTDKRQTYLFKTSVPQNSKIKNWDLSYSNEKG